MPADKLEVDVVSSYARRDGDRVRLVLTLPTGTALDGRRAWVRLVPTDDAAAFRVPTEISRVAAGWRLRAEAEGAALAPGLWRLWLRVGANGPLHRLQACLLMSHPQPIALLPGKRPLTLMEPPAPRRPSDSSGAGGGAQARER